MAALAGHADHDFRLFHCRVQPEGSAAWRIQSLPFTQHSPAWRVISLCHPKHRHDRASLLILGLRIKVEWNYIRFVTLVDRRLVFGTYKIARWCHRDGQTILRVAMAELWDHTVAGKPSFQQAGIR